MPTPIKQLCGALLLCFSFIFGCNLLSQEGIPRAPSQGNLDAPKNDAVNVPFWGNVVELTKDSITVHLTNVAGEKPKRFILSEALASGQVPNKPRKLVTKKQLYHVNPCSMYRLCDIKVGDVVIIYYARIGNTDICDHICIRKRPGGHVPPLPTEAEDLLNPETIIKAREKEWLAKQPAGTPPLPPLPKGTFSPYIPYHEYWNAYWDLEDKGIPYPEKFGKNRRFPVAPMPREAKPKP